MRISQNVSLDPLTGRQQLASCLWLLLVAIALCLPSTSNCHGQVEIRLLSGPLLSPYEDITVGDIAFVSTEDDELKQAIESVVVETFESQNQVEVSGYQVRIRLALSDVPIRTSAIQGPPTIVVQRSVGQRQARSMANRQVSTNPPQQATQRQRREPITAQSVAKAKLRVNASLAATQTMMKSNEHVARQTTEPAADKTLESAISRELSAQFGVPASEIDVQLSPTFKRQNEGLDYTTLQLETSLDVELPLGRRTLTTVIDGVQGQPIVLRVPVTIAILRNVVIAQTNIARGQKIQRSDVEVVRRPVSSRSAKIATLDQVIGMVAQSNLSPYELIRSESVRTVNSADETAIKRNAAVSVIAKRGALTVKLNEAKALQDGAVGERIAVLNLATQQRLFGTVVDSSTIEIRY